MRNMLVTGGCGFIGSNFVRYLLEESDFTGRIINVDKLTYAGNPENLAGLEERFPGRYVFEQGDICDGPFIESVFSDHGIDCVCHFAAESHVDRSIVAPDAFIRTNIVGTFTLLEQARAHSGQVRLFHHISTDEVYGSLGREGAFTESTPYCPSSPYSASKASSDHLVRAYHTTYGLPVTLSNCSNNYGPYQFPEKLIPLMVLNACEGRPLPIYGDGRQVRDWLYVRDHCRAIWAIMKEGRRGATYNIGGNQEMENLALVERICDILEEERPPENGVPYRSLIRFVKDRPGHDLRYAMDFTRLRTELGWRPEESLDTGLRKTVRWYLEHGSWVDCVRSGEYRRWVSAQYG